MANSNLLYGTWKFNETLTSMPTLSINFSTIVYEKEEYFTGMQQWSNEFAYTVYINDIKNYRFVYKNSWYDESYRTIKVTTTSNETVLTWLQANAVKLSDNLEELRKKKQIYNDLMNELSDVINNKAGTTGKKVLSQIVETAKTIETGVTPSGTVSITSNGTHDVTNYANANVNVPIPSDYIKPSGNLEITNNGNYNVKEKESVSVNVPSSGITPTGTYEVTNNGEYDITEYAKVNVNVASSGGNNIDELIEGSITEITSNRVTKIRPYAFYYCKALTSISLPNATNIDIYAFYYCSALTNIDLPLVTSVGSYAFNSCSALTNIDLPLVTSVGGYAFYTCLALTSVNLPLVTSDVGAYTFAGCNKLTSVNLPLVTSVGNYAFQMCELLTNMNLPNATTLNNYAFHSCYKLTSVFIPLVTSIGKSTFYSCYLLKAVIIQQSNTVCTLSNTNAFSSCHHILGTVNSTYNPNGDKDGYIYVPDSLVDSYKSATNWSTYADQIKPLSELPQEYKDLYNIA